MYGTFQGFGFAAVKDAHLCAQRSGKIDPWKSWTLSAIDLVASS
jgi:hypothetical protein